MMQRVAQVRFLALATSMMATHALAQVPPAASATGVLLPEVSLPAVPAAAGQQPPLPSTAAGEGKASTAAETAPPPEQFRSFSFGSSQLSLLFMPQQIMQMKDAIVAFESSGSADPSIPGVDAPPANQPAEITNEPPEYPVFFLSSIVYETPKEWSIWLGGHKITSRKNNTDLNILSVSRESVTFSWSPEYARYITRRRNEGLMAPTDPVKHKLVPQQSVTSDDQGTITFTLRQNQSFSVGYYSIFEGYMSAPTLIPLLAEQSPDGSVPFDPRTAGASAASLPGMSRPDAPPPRPSVPPHGDPAPTPPIVTN